MFDQPIHRLVRPSLLMLSHCVPSAEGHADRARAWQMLRLAAQGHRVWLVCLHDAPLTLAQWRAIRAHADAIAIEKVGPASAALNQSIGWINPVSRRRAALSGALSPTVETWTAEQRFDAVLCTHPALWPAASSLGCSLSVCDLDTPASVAHGRLASAASAAHRWWHNRQFRQCSELEHSIARECDVLTISHAEDRLALGAAAARTIVLPDAVDPEYVDCAPPGDGEENPSLVFHANWERAAGTVARDWFAREVWPSVRRAVPGATMLSTQASRSAATLQSASVVVSADPDPGISRWPILQAMAMRRPVVAADDAVRDMNVRHGEHLLLTRRTGDWVEHCVESLRSSQVRLSLARAARAYVEAQGRVNHFAQLLFADAHPPIARAA